MQKLLLVSLLFSMSYCNTSNTSKSPGRQLLDKTIAYHDPQHKWPELKTRLYFTHIDTAGKGSPFEIEMDKATGYFAHISHKEGKEIVKGISGGKEFFAIDGKNEISNEDREKYGLTPERAQGTKRFYEYLYGLPMKLTDPGANLSDTVLTQQFNGKTYQTIRVTYDPEVGKDVWTFYINPATSAMEGYSFLFGADTDEGEYITLDQELEVEGIKIPKVRKWHFLKGDKYLGTDSLIRAEKLTSYRM